MSIDYETLRQAYVEYRSENGAAKLLEVLKEVGGADSLEDVPELRRAALLRAFQGKKSTAPTHVRMNDMSRSYWAKSGEKPKRPKTFDDLTTRAYSKWNAAGGEQ